MPGVEIVNKVPKVIFIILSFLWAFPSYPQILPTTGLTAGGFAQVQAVIDGDTVLLADGREVRLVGIQAPKLPLGRPDFEAWPLADSAKSVLEDMVLGEKVSLYYGGREVDRHGRALAHIVDEQGNWVQAALLRAGLARVYSFPDNRSLVSELYTFEQAAREKLRGIWAHPYYAALRAEEIEGQGAALEGRFHIITGQLVSANLSRGRLYFNFGTRWSSDFTAIIEKRALKLFDAPWVKDPSMLSGQKVEVRGWTRDADGPMIEITHPEQIRFLEVNE